MSLIDIQGDLGSGKTFWMTWFSTLFNRTYTVFANYKLNLPNFKPLQLDELLDLQFSDALVLLDEADELINSYRAMSNLSLFINYALKQSRKKRLIIVASAQLLDLIDSRYTRLSKYSIIAFGFCKIGFQYAIIRKSIFGDSLKLKYIPSKYIQQVYDLYDTNEPIKPPKIEELKAQVQSKEKLKEQVDKIVSEIIDRKEEFCITKKVTEKQIRYILLGIKDAPTNIASLIQTGLNQKLGFS